MAWHTQNVVGFIGFLARSFINLISVLRHSSENPRLISAYDKHFHFRIIFIYFFGPTMGLEKLNIAIYLR